MKCIVCKFNIDYNDKFCGHIIENTKVYCEKCYANKRYKEISNKIEWITNVKTLINSNIDTETVMRKIPNEWESLILDDNKVLKIREKWAKMKWYP